MPTNFNDSTPAAGSGRTNVTWQKDGSGNVSASIATPTTGTVTSVAVTVPAELSVSGSPVTSSGTIAITKANESANTVWAGPTTGAAAQPTFRALVANDLPAGTGTVTSVGLTVPSDLSVSGSPVTTTGTLAITANTQLANLVKAGPASGGAATPGYRALVAADLPLATTLAFGAIKPDGTTCNVSGGVLSASGTGGSVTSVALTVPAEFSVSGSPVTSAGTLAVTAVNESANTVWAGPTTGAATTPAFRALVSADIPLATSSVTGAVKPDNSTITISGGVISALAGGGSSLALVEQHTASSSATLDFTSGITSSFDDYMFELVQVVNVTDGVNFIIRCSTDGGSTYDSGLNYTWARYESDIAGGGSGGSGSDTSIEFADAISNLTSWSLSGSINLRNPGSTSNFKNFEARTTWFSSTLGQSLIRMTCGFYKLTTAVNAIRFQFSSGNIASGVIRLYGLAK